MSEQQSPNQPSKSTDAKKSPYSRSIPPTVPGKHHIVYRPEGEKKAEAKSSNTKHSTSGKKDPPAPLDTSSNFMHSRRFSISKDPDPTDNLDPEIRDSMFPY